MNFKEYIASHRGLMALNKVQGIGNVALALTCFLLAYLVLDKKEIVVFQPMTLTEQAWVQEKSSSKNLTEAYALFFADLLGNVTPKNIDIIVEKLGRFLGPSIYQNTMDMMYKQVEAIKQDRVVFRFDVAELFTEDATGKIFVVGVMRTSGASSDKESTGEMQTFEFKINIVNYQPVIQSLNSYAGRPLTQAEIQNRNARVQEKEEALRLQTARGGK